MWEKRSVEQLRKGDIFLYEGDHLSGASVVSTPVTPYEGTGVRFCTHARWSDRPEGPSIVRADTPVYVLKCTCRGMSFICNRWVFTGECSCVHVNPVRD